MMLNQRIVKRNAECVSLETETVFREGHGYFVRCKNCGLELVHKTSFDGAEGWLCAAGHAIAREGCGFCQRKLARQYGSEPRRLTPA